MGDKHEQSSPPQEPTQHRAEEERGDHQAEKLKVTLKVKGGSAWERQQCEDAFAARLKSAGVKDIIFEDRPGNTGINVSGLKPNGERFNETARWGEEITVYI